jgi:hypothetical protein
MTTRLSASVLGWRSGSRLHSQDPTFLDHATSDQPVGTMDRITARADNDFNVPLYGALWIAALAFIWITCRADPEEPVKYEVETPEQARKGWKGQVLEKPQLKVYICCLWI